MTAALAQQQQHARRTSGHRVRRHCRRTAVAQPTVRVAPTASSKLAHPRAHQTASVKISLCADTTSMNPVHRQGFCCTRVLPTPTGNALPALRDTRAMVAQRWWLVPLAATLPLGRRNAKLAMQVARRQHELPRVRNVPLVNLRRTEVRLAQNVRRASLLLSLAVHRALHGSSAASVSECRMTALFRVTEHAWLARQVRYSRTKRAVRHAWWLPDVPATRSRLCRHPSLGIVFVPLVQPDTSVMVAHAPLRVQRHILPSPDPARASSVLLAVLPPGVLPHAALAPQDDSQPLVVHLKMRAKLGDHALRALDARLKARFRPIGCAHDARVELTAPGLPLMTARRVRL